jgi:predicted DNA-binding transcriptional regulator AlpA
MNEVTNKMIDRIIRFPELEKLFARCKKSIRRHSAVGKLPRLVKDGKIVGMLESDVAAYFQRLKVKPAQ